MAKEQEKTATYRVKARCFVNGVHLDPGATFEAKSGLKDAHYEEVKPKPVQPAPKPAKGAGATQPEPEPDGTGDGDAGADG